MVVEEVVDAEAVGGEGVGVLGSSPSSTTMPPLLP
jgi:hypothetical protein